LPLVGAALIRRRDMTKLMKLVLVGAAVGMVAGGCASRYNDYDNGYYDANGSYSRYDRTQHWRDRDHWRDHNDRSDWRGDRHDNDRRVRVCDADGDDCHWEYRDR
jgi:hypothetical protein